MKQEKINEDITILVPIIKEYLISNNLYIDNFTYYQIKKNIKNKEIFDSQIKNYLLKTFKTSTFIDKPLLNIFLTVDKERDTNYSHIYFRNLKFKKEKYVIENLVFELYQIKNLDNSLKETFLLNFSVLGDVESLEKIWKDLEEKSRNKIIKYYIEEKKCLKFFEDLEFKKLVSFLNENLEHPYRSNLFINSDKLKEDNKELSDSLLKKAFYLKIKKNDLNEIFIKEKLKDLENTLNALNKLQDNKYFNEISVKDDNQNFQITICTEIEEKLIVKCLNQYIKEMIKENYNTNLVESVLNKSVDYVLKKNTFKNIQNNLNLKKENINKI